MKNTDMEKKSTYVDELTRLYNRQYLEEKQTQKVRALVAHGTPFSIAIVDIDHFKEINDTYGHMKGDEVLSEFAQFLRRELRKSDTIIRYGGDEFVCIMSKTMRQDAEWIYRRIVKACRNKQFSGLQLTLSAGIAAYPEDGKTLHNLLKVADGALYAAKRRGRDQIHMVEKKAIELPIKHLVNRDNEKEALKTALAHDGEHVAIVIVRGCVGVGKTRLVRDVLDNIHGREIIWADCLLMAEGISYYPIREAIRYRITRRSIDMFTVISWMYRYEVAKIIPEMSETITEDISEKESMVDKYRLFEGIRRILQAGDFPKTMVIDNIQWIDKASLEVVEYLVRSLERFTFVFIHRSEETNDSIDTFMKRIKGTDYGQDIALTAFGQSDIQECICAILGEEPSDKLTEYVTEESAGIPYYIEEIMRGLYHNHYLVIEDGAWQFKQPHKEIVPKSLEDIALRKYRSVSKKSQDVLDIASVIGWFDLEIIQQMAELDETELVDLLKTMAGFGLVKYKGDHFEFTEEISRNAIYKKCVEGIKGMTLHKQIAERLEQQYESDEKNIVRQLAHHYYHAHDKNKGIQYCILAGDMSKAKYAHEEAARDYTCALELLGDDREERAVSRKIDCLLKRAYALCAMGDPEAALKDLADGLKYARDRADTKRQADILAKRASVYHDTSRNKEAISEAGKSRKLYEQINDVKGIAGALITVAFSHLVLTEPDKAIEKFTEALQMYENTGDRSEQSRILNHLGNVYFTLGDFERALDFYEKALKMAHETDDTLGIGMASGSIGIVCSNLGEYQRALTSYEQALAIMMEIGHRRQEAVTRANIAIIHDELGDYNTSLQYHKAALKIAIEMGYTRGEALYRSNMSSIYGKLGQHHTALNLLEDSLEIAHQIGFRLLEAHILSNIGHVYYLLGNYSRAFEHSRQAEELIQKIHVDREVFYNALVLAELHMVVNETERAKQYIDSAHEIASRLQSKRMLFHVQTQLCDYYLTVHEYDLYKDTMQQLRATVKTPLTAPKEGIINLLSGRYYLQVGKASKARTMLGRALKVFRDLGEQLNIGEVHYYRGMLEHKKGDLRKAKRNFEKALSIFDSIGAKAWSEKGHKALDNIQ